MICSLEKEAAESGGLARKEMRTALRDNYWPNPVSSVYENETIRHAADELLVSRLARSARPREPLAQR